MEWHAGIYKRSLNLKESFLFRVKSPDNFIHFINKSNNRQKN